VVRGAGVRVEPVGGGSFKGVREWIAPLSGVLVDWKCFRYVDRKSGEVGYRYQLVLDRPDGSGYQYKCQVFDAEQLDLDPVLGAVVRFQPGSKRPDEYGFLDETGGKFTYTGDMPAGLREAARRVDAAPSDAVRTLVGDWLSRSESRPAGGESEG
jgi:hypothetical protein